MPVPSSQSEIALLDLTLPTPAQNLALDEALLNEADEAARRGEAVRELLRLWESPLPFVALGSTRPLAEEVDQENCRREGVALVRRSSGGGTVLGGPGCLCFSLILSLETRPELRDISRSYRVILSRLAECLGVEGLSHRGICDLALGDRKVSGNAQRRKSRSLLHHGTILYDFDRNAMARFLKTPCCQPEYRAGRAHGEFTTNLPLPGEEIKRRLARGWNAAEPGSALSFPESTLSELALPDLDSLLREKYANPSWLERF